MAETQIVPYNMMLTTLKVREKLFAWLMEIINPLETRLANLSSDPTEKRWPGYLAERLATYFWHSHTSEINQVFVKTLRLDAAVEVDTSLFASDHVELSRRFKLLELTAEKAREDLRIAEGNRLSLEKEQERIKASLSWRLTAPARKALEVFLK